MATAENVSWPPVRLKDVAPSFQVRARPEFEIGGGEGGLQYDVVKGCFTIILTHSAEGMGREYGATLMRARFTYAHEFAHRFFYVRKDSGWERAAKSVMDKLEPKKRPAIHNSLWRMEEEVCNRIAARLLVPNDAIVGAVREFVKGGGDEAEALFGSLPAFLSHGARRFAVSRHVIAVALGRAPVASSLGFGEAVVLTRVRRSALKGGRGRASRKLRSYPILWPSVIDGTRVSSGFPGLAIENLGQEFCLAVKQSVSGAREETQFASAMEVETVKGGRKAVHIRGRAYPYSLQGSEDILIWGTVAGSDTDCQESRSTV